MSERIGAIIWLLLGIGVCIGSTSIGMGNIHKPGPGFMPFLAGALLGLFGLIFLHSTRSKGGDAQRQIASSSEGIAKNWKMCFACLLALFGCAFLLEPLGFFTTSGLFLFALFKMQNPKRWVRPLIYAALTVVFSYLLFTVLLNIRFPTGISGF